MGKGTRKRGKEGKNKQKKKRNPKASYAESLMFHNCEIAIFGRNIQAPIRRAATVKW